MISDAGGSQEFQPVFPGAVKSPPKPGGPINRVPTGSCYSSPLSCLEKKLRMSIGAGKMMVFVFSVLISTSVCR